MLEEKDLQAIEKLLDNSLTRSQNMILNELDRVQDNLQERVERLEKNLEEMRHQLGVIRLETDNVNLFLGIVNDLRKRIEELEKKTA